MPSFSIPVIVDTNGKVKTTLTGAQFYTATNRVLLKRNDVANLGVQFVQAGTVTPFLLPSGSIVQVALKEKGKYGAGLDYAAFSSTAVTPATSTDPYVVQLPISGSVLDTLFGSAPSENAYCDLMFEVTWSSDGGTSWNSTSDPVEARVYNDVIRPATNTPPIVPSLNIPQIYRDKGVISAVGGTLVKKIDLASIFGLVAGDTAQFEITAGSYVRAAYASSTPTNTNCLYSSKAYATVDFSSTFNYDTNADVPLIDMFWDDPIGTPDLKWGTLSLTPTGGGLDTPNAVFKQAGAITLTFAHAASTAPSPNDQAAITDVQCFLQIQLLSVTNSAID